MLGCLQPDPLTPPKPAQNPSAFCAQISSRSRPYTKAHAGACLCRPCEVVQGPVCCHPPCHRRSHRHLQTAEHNALSPGHNEAQDR